MLPYKTYELYHNNDKNQNWKVFIFGEFAIFTKSKKTDNKSGDLWKLYEETGVKYDYYTGWRNNIIPTTKFRNLNLVSDRYSFDDVHRILKDQKFNNKFEELLK